MSEQLAGRAGARRALAAALMTCAVIGSGSYRVIMARQDVAPALSVAATGEFRQQVLPVLSETCMTCHNDQEQAGQLSFERFLDPKADLRQPELWSKVLEKLVSGEMPPATMGPLAPGESATMVG